MDLRKYSDETWDRFFDLIADTSDLTNEEISADLKEAGIDMAPAVERLHKMLEEHRRRHRAAKAE